MKKIHPLVLELFNGWTGGSLYSYQTLFVGIKLTVPTLLSYGWFRLLKLTQEGSRKTVVFIVNVQKFLDSNRSPADPTGCCLTLLLRSQSMLSSKHPFNRPFSC
ncbi:unnamed protein product, partial [Owenia fusiformis]